MTVIPRRLPHIANVCRAWTALGIIGCLSGIVSTRVGGQSSGPRVSYTVGAMGVGAVTRAAPGVVGVDVTEGYFTQPNVMGRVRRGPLSLNATVNFEGYTLQRGELNAGIYGEGYVDRRHPHTLVHEVMFVATSGVWRNVRASLAAGKGFTPYGTDDPMMRPMVKFPVNHHHAQIIERVQTVAAVRVGDQHRGAALEHAFFNGDEPVGPFIGPQWKRFGDSRTTRLTLMPATGVEMQVSRAFVRSPGITQGGAFDHTQTSASLRFDRVAGAVAPEHTDPSHAPMSHAPTSNEPISPESMSRTGMSHGSMNRDRRYLLVEVARTDEGFGPSRVFRFNSILAEGLWGHRGWNIALRGERTDRPESERLLNLFRTANGHIDFQLIGITRLTMATAHLDAPSQRMPVLTRTHLTPFVEVTRAVPTALRTPAVFVPREFYGARQLWQVTLGARLHMGTMATRMGRYGVLDFTP